jgi:hypothetical protein
MTMAINRNSPELWKDDVAASVDLYNDWFMRFAPQAFRDTRLKVTKDVEATLLATDNLRNVKPDILLANPSTLPTLRMCTCPPLARDRLIGLAKVSKNLVERMEKEGKVPPGLSKTQLDAEFKSIAVIIQKLADRDILTWLDRTGTPTRQQLRRSATIVADRLCGATADPIIRSEQEARQLRAIASWLDARGYKKAPAGSTVRFNAMAPGTYAFHVNVHVTLSRASSKMVNIPVDVAIMRKNARPADLPVCVEAKSAGDFTNVNKRRKEEAQKMSQLKNTFGGKLTYVLFLCGYFDAGYLGNEAAEGIDWIWEHRINDFAALKL